MWDAPVKVSRGSGWMARVCKMLVRFSKALVFSNQNQAGCQRCQRQVLQNPESAEREWETFKDRPVWRFGTLHFYLATKSPCCARISRIQKLWTISEAGWEVTSRNSLLDFLVLKKWVGPCAYLTLHAGRVQSEERFKSSYTGHLMRDTLWSRYVDVWPLAFVHEDFWQQRG